MLGLLGGLLGGAARGRAFGGGGGGILRNLSSRRSGGGGSSMPSYSARPSQAPAEEPEQPESAPPPPAPEPQPTPSQQPPPAPAAQQVSGEVEKAQSVAQAQANKTPLSGLMEPAPTAPAPKQTADSPVPPPPSVVNRTETMSPVASQPSSSVGFVQQPKPTEILRDQLADSKSYRPSIQFQEGLPAREVDTSGSDWTPPIGLQYRQSTTVAGSVPTRSYRSI
jgi:hypothetical protein